MNEDNLNVNEERRTILEAIAKHNKYINSYYRRDFISKIVGLCLILLTGIGFIIYNTTTNLISRTDSTYFQNAEFVWDDDNERYDVFIQESDSLMRYSVPVSKATLIYSTDNWTCFGDVTSCYNVFGKLLEKSVKDFHINVYREA